MFKAKPKQRFLIMDDERTSRAIIRQILLKQADANHELVDEAGDTTTASGKLSNLDYACVFLDFWMGDGKSGLDILKMIRLGKTIRPDTRVVMVTGHAMPDLLSVALALDVNGLLTKPVRPAVFLTTVAKAVTEPFQARSRPDYLAELEAAVFATEANQRRIVAEARGAAKEEIAAKDQVIPDSAVRRSVADLRLGDKTAIDIRLGDGKLVINANAAMNTPIIARMQELAEKHPELKSIYVFPAPGSLAITR